MSDSHSDLQTDKAASGVPVVRMDGHSALRVRDGKLEKFDPHPESNGTEHAAWHRAYLVESGWYPSPDGIFEVNSGGGKC